MISSKSVGKISDKTINELWRSPQFSASYRGIKTFKRVLKTDLDIDISESRLFNILKKDPVYLIHLKPARNFERRHISVNNYGELVQADIAQMYTYNSYKYFLLLVDAFSTKVFVRPLKSKETLEVTKAFEDIFEEFKATIYVLQTDRGKGKNSNSLFLFLSKRSKLGQFIQLKSKYEKVHQIDTFQISNRKMELQLK